MTVRAEVPVYTFAAWVEVAAAPVTAAVFDGALTRQSWWAEQVGRSPPRHPERANDVKDVTPEPTLPTRTSRELGSAAGGFSDYQLRVVRDLLRSGVATPEVRDK